MYEIDEIFSLQSDWTNYMSTSWEAGEECIEYVDNNRQLTTDNEKEPFMFNFLHKAKSEVQSQAKDLELSLILKNVNNCKEEEATVFKKLFSQLMLNSKNKKAFQQSLDKIYDFGHSVLHVKPQRIDDKTLNEELIVENLVDPRQAFFDIKSKSPMFDDGNFCGLKYEIEKDQLVKIYPSLNNLSLEGNIDVIDFWYKSTKKKKYIKLMNNEYKRQDFINESIDDIDYTAKPKMGTCVYLNYVRCIKECFKFLEKKEDIDCKYLPLILNPGQYVWDATNCQYHFYPFAYRFKGSQALINNTGSILIDIAKNVNADKWLFQKEHLQSPDAVMSAENINNLKGGVVFTGNTGTIRREPPQQLPTDLMSFFIQSPDILQRLVGSYFDNNSAQIKAVSGVALDKLFNRLDLIQNNVIVNHLHTINMIGFILQQMIPLYYYQEREIAISCENGQIEHYVINQKIVDMGIVTYRNAIFNIKNKYEYEIDIQPSKRLRDQNAKMELESLYNLMPQAMPLTIDLYVQTLNLSMGDILSKRLSTSIPQPLMDYSEGKITYEEYQQENQQHMEKQQQMQTITMQNNPQNQLLTSRIQTEQAKASAQQYRAETEQYKAETERSKMLANANNDRMKNMIQSNHFIMEHARNEQQRKTDLLTSVIDHLKSLLAMEQQP